MIILGILSAEGIPRRLALRNELKNGIAGAMAAARAWAVYGNLIHIEGFPSSDKTFRNAKPVKPSISDQAHLGCWDEA